MHFIYLIGFAASISKNDFSALDKDLREKCQVFDEGQHQKK